MSEKTERFELRMTKEEMEKLEWAAKTAGLSKTQILMAGLDKEFQWTKDLKEAGYF